MPAALGAMHALANVLNHHPAKKPPLCEPCSDFCHLLLLCKHRQFGEEFHLEIHDALALVEVELESVDNAGSKHALGMIKAVIPDIPLEESDQWWMLRLKDGAPKTTQLNVSMFFEKFVEDATQRRLRLRSMREAKIKDAAADAPGWISAWDVRAVKNYEDEVMEARKIVMIALADGGLPKVAAAARRIKELSMQHEEKSKALLAVSASSPSPSPSTSTSQPSPPPPPPTHSDLICPCDLRTQSSSFPLYLVLKSWRKK
jgi:hypothetical protein